MTRYEYDAELGLYVIYICFQDKTERCVGHECNEDDAQKVLKDLSDWYKDRGKVA